MTERTIKFRVYAKKRRLMIDPENDGFSVEVFGDGSFSYEMPDPDNEGATLACCYDEGDVLLQFTGITDDCGDEIFDGHIVIDAQNQNTVGLVKWMETGWGMLPCPDYRDFGELVERDRLRIVGNIYQNPELLERAP